MAEAMVKNIHGNWQVSVDATDEIEKGNESEVVEAAFHQGKELAEARIRELEAENAALKESALAKANDIISRRNAQLREALGAADEKLKDAVDYHNAAEDTHANDTRELIAFIKKTRTLIDAALKRENA